MKKRKIFFTVKFQLQLISEEEIMELGNHHFVTPGNN